MNRNNSFYEPQTIPPISHYSNGTITEHERRTSSVTVSSFCMFDEEIKYLIHSITLSLQ